MVSYISYHGVYDISYDIICKISQTYDSIGMIIYVFWI